MRYHSSAYSLFLLLINLGACIEPFSPSVDAYEDALVVDALITNDSSQRFVKLSRTRSLNLQESCMSFETGATLYLIDSDGETFEFSESFTNPGVYSSFINPEVGKEYILSITTRERKVYNSDPVVMKDTPLLIAYILEEQPYLQRNTVDWMMDFKYMLIPVQDLGNRGIINSIGMKPGNWLLPIIHFLISTCKKIAYLKEKIILAIVGYSHHPQT